MRIETNKYPGCRYPDRNWRSRQKADHQKKPRDSIKSIKRPLGHLDQDLEGKKKRTKTSKKWGENRRG